MLLRPLFTFGKPAVPLHPGKPCLTVNKFLSSCFKRRSVAFIKRALRLHIMKTHVNTSPTCVDIKLKKSKCTQKTHGSTLFSLQDGGDSGSPFEKRPGGRPQKEVRALAKRLLLLFFWGGGKRSLGGYISFKRVDSQSSLPVLKRVRYIKM